MNKVIAGLLGAVAVELAVLDYAAIMLLKNGTTIEITESELEQAEKAFEQDLNGDVAEEVSYWLSDCEESEWAIRLG